MMSLIKFIFAISIFIVSTYVLNAQCSSFKDLGIYVGRDRDDYFDNKQDNYNIQSWFYYCNNKDQGCVNVIKLCIKYDNHIILDKIKYEIIVKEASGKILLKKTYTYKNPNGIESLGEIPIEIFLDKPIKSKYSFAQHPPQIQVTVINSEVDKKETANYIIKTILEDDRYQQPSKLKHFYMKAKEYYPNVKSSTIENMINSSDNESNQTLTIFKDFFEEFKKALASKNIDYLFNNFIADIYSHPGNGARTSKGNNFNQENFDELFSETINLFDNSNNYQIEYMADSRPVGEVAVTFTIYGVKHIYKFLKTDEEGNKNEIRNTNKAFNLSYYWIQAPETNSIIKDFNLTTIQSFIKLLEKALIKKDKSSVADVLTRFPLAYTKKEFLRFDKMRINKVDDNIFERQDFIKYFDKYIFNNDVVLSILKSPAYSKVDINKLQPFSLEHLKTMYGGEVEDIYSINFKDYNFYILKINNEFKLNYIEIK